VPPANQGRCKRARASVRDEGSNAGGVAEHLVEREDDKIRRARLKIKRASGHKGSRVEKHIEPQGMRVVDQAERVPDTREVRLCGKGNEGAVPRGLRPQQAGGLDQPQLVVEGCVADRRTGPTCVLPNAIQRIVVVGGEHESVAVVEGVAFRDQLCRGSRVRGEADGVSGGVDAEKREHRVTGVIEQHRASARRGVRRVWVAEDAAFEDGAVRFHERHRRETRPGVVEIHLPLLIEARELALPKGLETTRRQHPRLFIASTR
jgi:hypothetical protein